MKKASIISAYLAIPLSLCAVETQTPKADKPDTQNLQLLTNATASPLDVNTIKEKNPEITTFVTLIDVAELKDLFNGTGPFTVYAPNNAAFEKLGKEKLDSLKKPENHDHLVDILLYHFVPGKYMAKSLKSNEFTTLEGKKLNVDVNNGAVKVNGATIIREDLAGPNGVIHVIDTVLIP